MIPDTIMWTPVQHEESLFYHCSVQFLGLVGQGISRSKHLALVFALQDLTRTVEQNPELCPR